MRHQTKVRKEAHLRVTVIHTPWMTQIQTQKETLPRGNWQPAHWERLQYKAGRWNRVTVEQWAWNTDIRTFGRNMASRKRRARVSVGVFLEQSKGQGVMASLSWQKSRHFTTDSTSHAVLLPLCWPPANPLVLLISVSPLPEAAVCTKETIRTFAVDKHVL